MHASTTWLVRYAGRMRGGVQVWRRGVDGHGIRHATAYALQGGCDAAEVERQVSNGADAAAAYGPDDAPTVVRHTARTDGIQRDRLDAEQLRAWIDGVDPETGEQRGRTMTSPDAHLLYDATINAPKSYSLAAVLHPELREEFDALMDRVTEETVTAWSEELTTRRGAGGKQRIGLTQVEVVTLDHERSRSLDPHAHRHLWLNAKVQGADGKVVQRGLAAGVPAPGPRQRPRRAGRTHGRPLEGSTGLARVHAERRWGDRGAVSRRGPDE